MLDKPSKEEDAYFAREDVEKKRKLAYQQAEVMAEQQKEALRTLHYMKCPKCGFDLHTLKRGDVDLDMCFNCKGLWVDSGELASFAKQLRESPEKRGTVMSALLNIFKND
jgi:uncharacterized protein